MSNGNGLNPMPVVDPSLPSTDTSRTPWLRRKAMVVIRKKSIQDTGRGRVRYREVVCAPKGSPEDTRKDSRFDENCENS
jgi:hypothetical protein